MTTGRNLEPTKFGVAPFKDERVYPNSKPDEYGQVHSGEKDKSAAGPSAIESVNQHRKSDLDSSRRAQHHTLGNGRNQAAPGDHIHDGRNGRKIGPMEIDPANPGKTRPELTLVANAAAIRDFLHNFFEFRDI